MERNHRGYERCHERGNVINSFWGDSHPFRINFKFKRAKEKERVFGEQLRRGKKTRSGVVGHRHDCMKTC